MQATFQKFNEEAESNYEEVEEIVEVEKIVNESCEDKTKAEVADEITEVKVKDPNPKLIHETLNHQHVDFMTSMWHF